MTNWSSPNTTQHTQTHTDRPQTQTMLRSPATSPAPSPAKRGAKRGAAETEERPAKKRRASVAVSSCVRQVCKGEDLAPFSKEHNAKYAFLVGDGHGGRSAVDAVQAEEDAILDAALENGAAAGLQAALSACAEERGGIMLTVGLYHESTRTLTLASAGDCSALVYHEGTLLHEQAKHDYSWYREHKLERWKLGIRPIHSFDELGRAKAKQPWKDEEGLWNWKRAQKRVLVVF